MNICYNIDCMDFMLTCNDKKFDLAIVDPPYGIERFKNAETSRISKYKSANNNFNDAKPDTEYFIELFRISKNQIIWGYNHLSDMLPSTKEFIFWYKHQPVISYSDGELAWTSFTKTAKCFDYPFFGSTGADKDGRIAPTQKPIDLYKWLLQNYAKPGQTIFDSHVGSGSIRIACHDLGFDFVGCELDKSYYLAQEERYNNYINQNELFKKEDIQKLIYLDSALDLEYY